MTTKALEYIEIDIPRCSLNYGVSPCTASIGVTGDAKCFNSIATCQDRPNFTEELVTLRFARAAEYLPRDIDALPWILSTDFTPAVVSLGEDLGKRAQFKCTLSDHPHSDVGPGFDKYVTERGYDPYQRGTFWPRFRARQPFLSGRNVRWIVGFVGQTLEEMETRHFFFESFEGPTPDGKYTIIAKDVLKFLDADRAQAPLLSNGFLVTGIDDNDVSATLSPSGIGNDEYPASGHVNIGGNEVCAFTRSGDVLTITRAQRGTTASSHSAQDRVQLCIIYDAQDPADIINDLITNYTDTPASYIPLTDWQNETATYLNRLYTATITEPVAVSKLVSEIVEQAALALWDDNVGQQLRLQVLRSIVQNAKIYSESNILRDSLKISDQPEKRASQVWFYYGQIDPTKPIENADNYRSTSRSIDDEAEEDYGASAIKKIFSRWIPALGRTVADRAGTIILGRYRDAPRKISFDLLRNSVDVPVLGSGYHFDWWTNQDASGAHEHIHVQVTRLKPSQGLYSVEVEESNFNAPAEDLSNRQIKIDFNVNNINLRTVHDLLYPEIESVGSPPVEVTCTVTAGVIVGSSSTASPAFDVGTWPAGVVVNLIVNGRIQGAGGKGGRGGQVGLDGQSGLPGGPALKLTYDLNLSGDGEIWGGGGGGGGGWHPNGGGGGGGGQGQIPGQFGLGAPGTPNQYPGTAGTTEAAGLGGNNWANNHIEGYGGNGGSAGNDGDDGVSTPGGSGIGGVGAASGDAIDGDSFVTESGTLDVRGPRIN